MAHGYAILPYLVDARHVPRYNHEQSRRCHIHGAGVYWAFIFPQLMSLLSDPAHNGSWVTSANTARMGQLRDFCRRVSHQCDPDRANTQDTSSPHRPNDDNTVCAQHTQRRQEEKRGGGHSWAPLFPWVPVQLDIYHRRFNSGDYGGPTSFCGPT